MACTEIAPSGALDRESEDPEEMVAGHVEDREAFLGRDLGGLREPVMIGWLIDLILGRKEEVHMNDFEAEELDRLLGNPPRADRTEAYRLMSRCAMTIGDMRLFVPDALGGKQVCEDGEDREEVLERLAERVEAARARWK